jgi:polyhydroxyalkanoate synthesis regulator phasin
MPPQTPTTYSFAALQRQQFLQPFEHLFDTIETTRALKSTLDDQIRRSSTLLQTLQASSTTVEGLIRSHVKEMQRDMTTKMDEVLDAMKKRIGQLESKLDVAGESPPSALPSSTTTTKAASTPAAPLKSPTTIVKSQNDIGPSEYQSMLTTLRERLDRLESQLDK